MSLETPAGALHPTVHRWCDHGADGCPGCAALPTPPATSTTSPATPKEAPVAQPPSVPTGPAIIANEKGPERQRFGWGTKRRQLSPAGVSVDLA
jgi:hypothetical protein